MAYNTGNPLGSSDPRDLFDNAQDLDHLVNGDEPTNKDRLGKSRKSWAGMEQEFADFLAASEYEFLGDYAADIEITSYNQVIRDGGEFWRAAADTEFPYTTTGGGMPESGAFVSVGDAVLRQDLADQSGAGAGTDIIGHDGETARAAINQRAIYVGSVASEGIVQVSVPTDYATLQEAIDFLFNTYKTENQIFGVVNIEAGHALNEGWRVENGDYSWIEINSDDATVALTDGFTPQSTLDLEQGVARTDKIGFLAVNAKAPKWNILVDASSADLVQGYAIVYDSYAFVYPGMGLINAQTVGAEANGNNVYVSSSSRLEGFESIWTGAQQDNFKCSVNSSADIARANCGSAGRAGIDVSRGSYVYAFEVMAPNCDRGCYVRRSILQAQGADFSGAGAVAIWSSLGSLVTANDALVGGSPSVFRLIAGDGGVIVANGALKNGGTDPLTISDINVDAFNRNYDEGAVYSDVSRSGSAGVLTASTLVEYESGTATVAASSYETIYNGGPNSEVFAGTIYGNDVGLRITIDGTVVLQDTVRVLGQDSVGDNYSVVAIPPSICKTSLLIEAYNRSTGSDIVAWRLHAKA